MSRRLAASRNGFYAYSTQTGDERLVVHLFRGPGRVFSATSDVTGANLPSKFAPWNAFKTIEIGSGTPVPGINVDECLRDIAQYGFHITDAHVRITERVL